MNTVLVVDDQKLFTEGLVHIFFNFELNVNVVAAHSAEAAFNIASERNDITLVLLDLSLPGIGGLRALEVFSEKYPSLPVIILSCSEDYADVQSALRLGAVGFISKTEKSLSMVSAIQSVIDGGIYVSPCLVRNRHWYINQPTPDVAEQSANLMFRQLTPMVDLTPRQLQITHLIVEGLANKEIARRLDVTEATIKAHVSAVLKAFNVPNRARIAKAVVEHGLEN